MKEKQKKSGSINISEKETTTESWLDKNDTAKKLVNEGLEDAKTGKLTNRELSSSSWIDEIDDEE